MQGFGAQSPQQKFFHMPRFSTNFQKNNNYYNAVQYKQHAQQNQNIEFDGKRLRKAVVRRTIDYNCAIIKQIEARVWQRDHRDQRALQPDSCYYTELIPPLYLLHNPINAVTTKFVRTSTNKVRCPIFCVAWTPEGRRLITGASSGEFTLWNGLTFNFETILQAHDSSVRCMVWSHNDTWMVTGDHSGFVKYWQSNMNNVKMFQAHKEPLRGISFCPTDQKFATCSDDGTVRIWDFLKCYEEKILRGHGADVKCLDWHPQKGLLVSGSKDSQQPIKLWDPKSGQSLATLHAHKSTVMEVKWNLNGNWLLTASRDHLIKLFDIRHLSQEVQTFRGHKKEVSCIAWHPIHESLFSSGGSDGAVMFWIVGADKEVGAMEQAHDSIVWSMAWHPLGHILCSGSNDHSSKFWTRNRPGDKMRDKYNLNTLPVGGEEAAEYDEPATSYTIPGMGLEHGLPDHLRTNEMMLDLQEMDGPLIPGLDFGNEEQMMSDKPAVQKKVPYAKPIPRQFQQQWMENKRPLLAAPPKDGVAPAGEIGAPPAAPPPPAPPGFGSGEQQMFPPRMHEMGPCFPVPPRMPGPRMNNPQPRFDAPGMRPRFLPPPPHGREEMSQRRGPAGEQHDMDQRSNPFQDAYENSPIQDSQLDSNSNFGDSDLRMLPQDTDSRNFQEDTRLFGDETTYHEERYPRSRSPHHEDPNNVSEFGYQDYDARNASNLDRGHRRGGPPPHRGRGRGRGSIQVGGPTPNDYGDSDLRISDNDMRNHPPSHDIDGRNLGPQHEGMGGYGPPPRKRGWNDNSKLEDRPPYYADNQHDEHYGEDYENNVSGGRGDGMKGRGMRRGMRSRGRSPYRGGRGRAIRIHQ